MPDPLVSVVIAIRNGAAYLREGIESVLRQSLTEFEVVVVDDASTDRTPELLAECAAADPRVSVVRHRSWAGLSASLNRGIALSRGSYIARHDADDVSQPNRLERQVAYLEDHADVGVLGTAYDVIDAAGRRMWDYRPPATDAGIRWEMLFHNAFCHSSVVFRRDLVGGSAGAYDPALPAAQDYELWTRMLRRTRGANLDATLVARRVHAASVTFTQRALQQRIASAIAARQLTALAPGVRLRDEDVEKLRLWYNAFPARLAAEDMKLCSKLASILQRFGEQEWADPVVTDRIRRRLVRRVDAAAGDTRGSAVFSLSPVSERAPSGDVYRGTV